MLFSATPLLLLLLGALASAVGAFNPKDLSLDKSDFSFVESSKGFYVGGADNSTVFNSTSNSKTASGISGTLEPDSVTSGTPTNVYDWKYQDNSTNTTFPVKCICSVDSFCSCNEQDDKAYWEAVYADAIPRNTTGNWGEFGITTRRINNTLTVLLNGTLGGVATDMSGNSSNNSCEASGKTKEQCEDEESIAAGVKAVGTAAAGVVVLAIGFFIVA